ncbi:MAG: hypothetical protein U1F10_02695 [Burkholderiales bacterium]
METIWIILSFWLGFGAGFVLLAMMQMSRQVDLEMPVHETIPHAGGHSHVS